MSKLFLVCVTKKLDHLRSPLLTAVRKLYIEIARNREKYVPIMSDFYEILMSQPEDEARGYSIIAGIVCK